MFGLLLREARLLYEPAYPCVAQCRGAIDFQEGEEAMYERNACGNRLTDHPLGRGGVVTLEVIPSPPERADVTIRPVESEVLEAFLQFTRASSTINLAFVIPLPTMRLKRG